MYCANNSDNFKSGLNTKSSMHNCKGFPVTNTINQIKYLKSDQEQKGTVYHKQPASMTCLSFYYRRVDENFNNLVDDHIQKSN